MDLKKKIGSIIGVIIAFWILCPLPELSILFGLLTGGTASTYFNVPWWSSWLIAVFSVPIGYLVFNKVGLLDKIKDEEKFIHNEV